VNGAAPAADQCVRSRPGLMGRLVERTQGLREQVVSGGAC
jgi:hypothetical protein